ncbi:hypothetical protein PENNAL_c0013G06118 [Penicillium nalgiovense]|uniref:Uncharacterized protein n=1 Tax=Penicillium nalgiovense TaxID=60175 RepID=A0A1V6YR01_PENNA|nr:hypothetical protein PENNAL_c0013G06118 [Penicillium nalgiovense]
MPNRLVSTSALDNWSFAAGRVPETISARTPSSGMTKAEVNGAATDKKSPRSSGRTTMHRLENTTWTNKSTSHS